MSRASDLLRKAEAPEPLPTMVPALDRLLGGGLARGRLTEIAARFSPGRFAIALSALASATRAGEVAALVDLGDHLDPQQAEEFGVGFSRLLWARPRRSRDALACAEMALATGFPLVVLDLGLPPVRGYLPVAAWVRLARAAEASHAALLVLSPYHLAGSVAHAVVGLERAQGVWSRELGVPRLLEGIFTRVHLEKQRGWKSRTAESLRLWTEGRMQPSARA